MVVEVMVVGVKVEVETAVDMDEGMVKVMAVTVAVVEETI